jgi:hypothetical protein
MMLDTFSIVLGHVFGNTQGDKELHNNSVPLSTSLGQSPPSIR